MRQGKRILSLPWELQDVECSMQSVQSASRPAAATDCKADDLGLTRSRDGGVPSFRLQTQLDEVIEVVWALNNGTGKEAAASCSGGAVRVALGSHRKPRHKKPDRGTLFEWEVLGAGDAIIFLGDTLHQHVNPHPATAGLNFLRASYHAAYLRQRKNMYTACPPRDAVKLPPYMQRLIGYSRPGR